MLLLGSRFNDSLIGGSTSTSTSEVLIAVVVRATEVFLSIESLRPLPIILLFNDLAHPMVATTTIFVLENLGLDCLLFIPIESICILFDCCVLLLLVVRLLGLKLLWVTTGLLREVTCTEFAATVS